MLDGFEIQSHKGPYSVVFDEQLFGHVEVLMEGEPHFIVDARVAEIYGAALAPVLRHPRCLRVEATEENKSLHRLIPLIEALVENRVRRDHTLVAIGGGIIQDATCFIASSLLRGVPWHFVPTTLLAQADSCIGSKSSINVGATKNIIGTFNPPRKVYVCSAFLETLADAEIRSGIGEILKVHAIQGVADFDRIAARYDRLLTSRADLVASIRDALLIKKPYIEIDEFDRRERLIFNYGHSFGHAIESATDFAIPHGIGVTIGVDMANRIASWRNLLPEAHYLRMHPVLRRNYAAFASTQIPVDAMLSALTRDKKNTTSKLVLILPVGDDARPQRVEVVPDADFRRQCERFLRELPA